MAEGDSITVSTSRWGLDGRHIYVTIDCDDNRYEYQARNIIDARGYIERVLERLPQRDIVTSGDTMIYFAYHRSGD